MYKEYRKTSTVKAKIFESGDEDGMTPKEDSIEALFNANHGIKNTMIPYIKTLESNVHIGEFDTHYICIGIDGERWLVEKSIFERTYCLESA